MYFINKAGFDFWYDSDAYLSLLSLAFSICLRNSYLWQMWVWIVLDTQNLTNLTLKISRWLRMTMMRYLSPLPALDGLQVILASHWSILLILASHWLAETLGVTSLLGLYKVAGTHNQVCKKIIFGSDRSSRSHNLRASVRPMKVCLKLSIFLLKQSGSVPGQS